MKLTEREVFEIILADRLTPPMPFIEDTGKGQKCSWPETKDCPVLQNRAKALCSFFNLMAYFSLEPEGCYNGSTVA